MSGNAGVFRPVYADSGGNLKTAVDLAAAGANGTAIWEMTEELLLPLPPGADLISMPGRAPIALEIGTYEPAVIEGDDTPVSAVAALPPVGYTRLLLPAVEDDGLGPELPLFGYTAVAERDGRLYMAAAQSDDPAPWAPLGPDLSRLEDLVGYARKKHPGNRVLAQLAFCALHYHCRTAQNLFLGRGEAGLPSAPSCNASCLACISLQPSGCCPSPQSRIGFVPSVDELAELAVGHLEASADAMISFGQGCEGEPLTVQELLTEAVSAIRRGTGKGVVNLNTNGSNTKGLAKMIAAGLDSVRISLFSAIDEDYRAYHRPNGYGLDDVRASLRMAVGAGCHVCLNLLVFPGFTDAPAQAGALMELCRESGLHQLQMRNLNIDPRRMEDSLTGEDTPGILHLLDRLGRELPEVSVGSYTHGR